MTTHGPNLLDVNHAFFYQLAEQINGDTCQKDYKYLIFYGKKPHKYICVWKIK